MNARTLPAMLVLAAGLALGAAPAEGLAQHAPGHAHAETRPPESFAEAVSRIREELAELEGMVARKAFVAAHDPADAIEQLASALGRLSLKPGSGVPREKVRDANLAGKDLAKIARQFHDAADRNDGAACLRLLPRLQELVAAVGAFAPEKWVCDMHCEPGKVFDGPGVCPVCRMAYKPISQVPYSANVAPDPAPIQPGVTTQLTIRLLDPAGNVLGLDALEIVHEEPLHLLMVNSDLSWYAHEHPTPRPDGAFVLPFAFPAPGEYTLFHDYTPKGKKQQVAPFKLKVAGVAPPPKPLVEDYDTVAQIEGYEFRVRCNGVKFAAAEDSIIRIGIDRDGEPVTDLEPYLGELGHLVIISADLKSFVHSHPLDMTDDHDGGDHGHAHGHAHDHDHDTIMRAARAAVDLRNGKPSDVVFHAVFPRPGLYKAFAQFQHKGKILTYPFVINAEPPRDGRAVPAGDDKHDHGGHDHSSHGATK